MNMLSKFNLKHRFNIAVLISIVVISSIFVLSIYKIIARQAHDYAIQYWQDYTKTFSNTAVLPLLIDSTPIANSITSNHTNNKTIRKSAIYTAQHVLIATSGSSVDCGAADKPFNEPFFIETSTVWCFSSPMEYKNIFIGNVELVVSKANFQSILQQILLTTILAVFIFAACIFLLVSYFSRLLTYIMVDISKTLKGVSGGGRGLRVTFSGAADINMMRDSFNEMLAKIELDEQILEQMVISRTNELKSALDSSQSANMYKSKIISLVSHEMRTPLHVAIGFMHTVSKGLPLVPDFDELRDFQSRALVRAYELKDIIESILLQGRLESGKFILTRSSVNLKLLIDQCANKCQTMRLRNQNTFTSSGEAITVDSDSVALTHIINNLIGNALKFTEHGEVHVHWWVDQNHFSIQVKDTGCGIAEANYENIFESFWQEDMRLERRFGGHGLGLAITKHLVGQLDGKISVARNYPKGTIFTVTVPFLIS
jgi:signal transduction histidine kinase